MTARCMSTGNFHTASLALAFETLGLADRAGRRGKCRPLHPARPAPAATACRNICRRSAAHRPASCRCRRRLTAILAAIRHKANPVMLDFLPVSEGVEDHATQTPLAISKCAEMIVLWRRLIAFELMAAAQAVDLRKAELAPGTASGPCAPSAHIAATLTRTGRSASTPRRSTQRCPAGSGRRSGGRPSAGVNSGSSIRQRSCALGQRVWKRQPDGGRDGLGSRRDSTSLRALVLGSITGLADSSACV